MGMCKRCMCVIPSFRDIVELNVEHKQNRSMMTIRVFFYLFFFFRLFSESNLLSISLQFDGKQTQIFDFIRILEAYGKSKQLFYRPQ